MNSLKLIALSLLLSSCVSTPQLASEEKVSRTIASEVDGVITIHAYHIEAGEDLTDIPALLESEFGMTGVNFKVDKASHSTGTHFSFEISRANALRIFDREMNRLRRYNNGLVRTPEQVVEDQRTANCELANLTVGNFLHELSATDQFNFRFDVPEHIRNIKLQSGTVDNSKPRCEIWGPVELYVTE